MKAPAGGCRPCALRSRAACLHHAARLLFVRRGMGLMASLLLGDDDGRSLSRVEAERSTRMVRSSVLYNGDVSEMEEIRIM